MDKTETQQNLRSKPEHFDVLIVGAGISGIGSAYQLTRQLPDKSFVILETQESFGGTWLTHKYPGIRSDSDLHTFGYSFKPWVGPPIATVDPGSAVNDRSSITAVSGEYPNETFWNMT